MMKPGYFRKKVKKNREAHFKVYFFSRKLSQYKAALKQYKHFELKLVMQYEKRWQSLKNKYKKIIIHGIEFVSIGETVPRLFNLLEDIQKENKTVLHVVLPTFFDYTAGVIYNYRLFDIFGRKIYFVRDFNIDFWTYVFYIHLKDIEMGQFDKYASARLGGIKVSLNRPLFPFTKREIEEGEKKLKNMGVDKEFICLHARESNVKTVCFSKIEGYAGKCRDCSIDTFMKASRFFASLNIKSIRMGKYELRKCSDETIIDYSNLYYDEFMDFYLISKCKFLIGCDSGLSSICGYWGKPVLMTNMVSICYGGESFPDTGYLMYIPKKFYSKVGRKYLNLYEMLNIMDECGLNTFNYVRKGIILEDNTSEEILDAAMELNERIDGLWNETKEEMEYYNRYWEIMHKWETDHEVVKEREKGSFKGYTMFFGRLSYNYLKNNLYLLEVDTNI